VVGSGVLRGERAAFSVAMTDKGRLRGRSECCDGGLLCCQLSVGLRATPAALVVVSDGPDVPFTFLPPRSSNERGDGFMFSFVESRSPVKLSRVSSIVLAFVELSIGGCSSGAGERATRDVRAMLSNRPPRDGGGVGVLSFEGDSDLARSIIITRQWMHTTIKQRALQRPPRRELTNQLCEPDAPSCPV
jgi:hypothetical protein